MDNQFNQQFQHTNQSQNNIPCIEQPKPKRKIPPVFGIIALALSCVNIFTAIGVSVFLIMWPLSRQVYAMPIASIILLAFAFTMMLPDIAMSIVSLALRKRQSPKALPLTIAALSIIGVLFITLITATVLWIIL